MARHGRRGAFIGSLGFRFRIGGVYFAVLTIAFAEFTRILFDHFEWVGGTAGFFRRLGSWLRYTETGNAQSYATVMAVGLLISIAAVLTWVLR